MQGWVFRISNFDFLSLLSSRTSQFLLTVSPNYKIPAKSFYHLNFPASHSNDEYHGTVS
jgi:hypothetical protein